MTPDHTFTDTEGGTVTGRAACRDAWAGFFAAFPDYRNVFTTVIATAERVALAGYSVCSEPALEARPCGRRPSTAAGWPAGRSTTTPPRTATGWSCRPRDPAR